MEPSSLLIFVTDKNQGVTLDKQNQIRTYKDERVGGVISLAASVRRFRLFNSDKTDLTVHQGPAFGKWLGLIAGKLAGVA